MTQKFIVSYTATTGGVDVERYNVLDSWMFGAQYSVLTKLFFLC